MEEHQAVVTYFYNSGFSVAVGETLLIFDYWRGDAGQVPRSAWITDWELRKYKQTLVFVSHDHEDHLDQGIYNWDWSHLPITYIQDAGMEPPPARARNRRSKSAPGSAASRDLNVQHVQTMSSSAQICRWTRSTRARSASGCGANAIAPSISPVRAQWFTATSTPRERTASSKDAAGHLGL